jgi:hypothetical protein
MKFEVAKEKLCQPKEEKVASARPITKNENDARVMKKL